MTHLSLVCIGTVNLLVILLILMRPWVFDLWSLTLDLWSVIILWDSFIGYLLFINWSNKWKHELLTPCGKRQNEQGKRGREKSQNTREIQCNVAGLFKYSNFEKVEKTCNFTISFFACCSLLACVSRGVLERTLGGLNIDKGSVEIVKKSINTRPFIMSSWADRVTREWESALFLSDRRVQPKGLEYLLFISFFSPFLPRLSLSSM